MVLTMQDVELVSDYTFDSSGYCNGTEMFLILDRESKSAIIIIIYAVVIWLLVLVQLVQFFFYFAADLLIILCVF